MNDNRLLIEGLELVSEGIAKIALAFDAPEPGEPAVLASATAMTPAPAGLPEVRPITVDDEAEFLADAAGLPKAAEPVGDQGSLAQCPKHHKPYRKSNFEGKPAYCTAQTDDPVWGKSRDGKLWCTINAANVHTWRKTHPVAA